MKKLLVIMLLTFTVVLSAAKKEEEPVCGSWSQPICFIEEDDEENDIWVCTQTRTCCYAGNLCWTESLEKEIAP